MILALIGEGYLPAPGLSLAAARASAGAGADRGQAADLARAAAGRGAARATPPVRMTDLLRAAYQEQAARDLLDRLGASPRRSSLGTGS